MWVYFNYYVNKNKTKTPNNKMWVWWDSFWNVHTQKYGEYFCSECCQNWSYRKSIYYGRFVMRCVFQDWFKALVHGSILPQSQICIFDIRNYFFMIARILTWVPPPCYDLLTNKGGGDSTLSKKTTFWLFGHYRNLSCSQTRGKTQGGTQE